MKKWLRALKYTSAKKSVVATIFHKSRFFLKSGFLKSRFHCTYRIYVKKLVYKNYKVFSYRFYSFLPININSVSLELQQLQNSPNWINIANCQKAIIVLWLKILSNKKRNSAKKQHFPWKFQVVQKVSTACNQKSTQKASQRTAFGIPKLPRDDIRPKYIPKFSKLGIPKVSPNSTKKASQNFPIQGFP